jgi:hypothetical protein
LAFGITCSERVGKQAFLESG